MNMRWYWTKIGISAGAIFLVGFSVLSAFRAGKRQVVRVVEGSDDLTIPLAFVPFKFDGERLGTFRKLVVHRSGPEDVTGVDVTVRLSHPSSVARLSCALTVDDPTRLNERSSFRCADSSVPMEGFGTLVFQVRDESGGWREGGRVSLTIPVEDAKKLRQRGATEVVELEADRFREIGDSLGVLASRLATASSDSARAAIQEEMSELRDQMEELKNAVEDVAGAKAEAAVARARAGAAPGTPRPPKPATPPPD